MTTDFESFQARRTQIMSANFRRRLESPTRMGDGLERQSALIVGIKPSRDAAQTYAEYAKRFPGTFPYQAKDMHITFATGKVEKGKNAEIHFGRLRDRYAPELVAMIKALADDAITMPRPKSQLTFYTSGDAIIAASEPTLPMWDARRHALRATEACGLTPAWGLHLTTNRYLWELKDYEQAEVNSLLEAPPPVGEVEFSRLFVGVLTVDNRVFRLDTVAEFPLRLA